jgi:transposase-like protein
MKPKSSLKKSPPKAPAERVVKDIRRATRRHFSAEDKIRIVLEGLRGEDSIAELCRKEGIAQSLYYTWSKEFMEAGNFHPALHNEVIAIGRVAGAMLARVPHDAAPGGRCRIDPQFAADPLQVAIKLHVGNARLDQRISIFFVDFDDPVHPFQIEDKISGFAGCRPAICEVPSSPDGPDRQSEAVGDGKDPLHLFDAFRSDGGRRKQSAIGKRRIRVAVSRQRKLVDENPGFADDACEFIEGP